MEAILTRRSIRKYTSAAVTREQIEALLKYAMSAPSAHNQQPWQFVVIDDRETLNKVPEFHPYSKMAQEAPLAILVCGDTTKVKAQGFWPQDCSAAVQNILVGAKSMGLGTVWCGVYPVEALVSSFRNLVAVPEEIIPFAFIVIGHPAEEKPPADRYDASRVHYNRW